MTENMSDRKWHPKGMKKIFSGLWTSSKIIKNHHQNHKKSSKIMTFSFWFSKIAKNWEKNRWKLWKWCKKIKVHVTIFNDFWRLWCFRFSKIQTIFNENKKKYHMQWGNGDIRMDCNHNLYSLHKYFKEILWELVTHNEEVNWYDSQENGWLQMLHQAIAKSWVSARWKMTVNCLSNTKSVLSISKVS